MSEQPGRKTQSQREVGMEIVLPVAPGSVAILETHGEQGKNLMEVLSISWGAAHLSRLEGH